MNRDPYNILQVAHHVEPEVVEAAFRRLALKYHPGISVLPKEINMSEYQEVMQKLADRIKQAHNLQTEDLQALSYWNSQRAHHKNQPF